MGRRADAVRFTLTLPFTFDPGPWTVDRLWRVVWQTTWAPGGVREMASGALAARWWERKPASMGRRADAVRFTLTLPFTFDPGPWTVDRLWRVVWQTTWVPGWTGW